MMCAAAAAAQAWSPALLHSIAHMWHKVVQQELQHDLVTQMLRIAPGKMQTLKNRW
jgi:hypothetical protein